VIKESHLFFIKLLGIFAYILKNFHRLKNTTNSIFMDAALIIIGNEVLSGETIDTNAQFIGLNLLENGFVVRKKITITDNLSEIIRTIDYLLVDFDLILITGGLGPTNDDVTRYALSEYFNSPLVFDVDLFEHIKELLKYRKPNLSVFNEQQAIIPECAVVLNNNLGTAPGLLLRKSNKVLIALPGVPYEVKGLMIEQVLPLLNKEFPLETVINYNIRTVGIPESLIASKIKDIEDNLPENIQLAYLPHIGQVKLRLTAIGNNPAELNSELTSYVQLISSRLMEYIYGYQQEELPAAIGRLLREKNATLAIAESCTGGHISHQLTTIPGSSFYFKGSVVSYANEVKCSLLGVDNKLLEKFGAVSEEIAMAMAKGVRNLMKTDYSLAATGIAGPDGGSAEKPIGTLWLAASSNDKTIAKHIVFDRGRLQNIQFFATFGLDLLRRLIMGIE
jgi:nicotinamide-nucleotide amidase